MSEKNGTAVVGWSVMEYNSGFGFHVGTVVAYNPIEHPEAPYQVRKSNGDFEWRTKSILGHIMPPTTVMSSPINWTNTDNTSVLRPPHSDLVSFKDPNRQVIGRLNIKDGKLVFEGDADEAARLFFDALKNFVDNYIEAHKAPASPESGDA